MSDSAASALPLVSLVAAVRMHIGLSTPQLARYLGVSTGFVSHVEAGRKGLPAALAPRLLLLSQLLPPPLGQGPPGPTEPEPFAPLTPLPAPDPLLLAAEAELAAVAPPAAEPLHSHLRDGRLRLLTHSQQLAKAQARAAALARRRWGLGQLQALTPPPSPAEAAHVARWLADLAADLARDDPDPAARAAARAQLAARVAGLRAEVAVLLEISG